MAETTGISWVRSTRNFWTGCTKVGPGCDGCYAEAFQRFVRGKDAETGEAKNWGPGRARIPHLAGAARDLHKWNVEAAAELRAGIAWKTPPWSRPPQLIIPERPFWPVFLNTQSDFFDNEVPQDWRDEACRVIEECTNLTFYLVTKRVGNVVKMVPPHWLLSGFPPHVRLLATVVNPEEAARDLPKLLELPCKNGVSYEPALAYVEWEPWLLKGLQWLIIGGESDQAGHRARGFDVWWAREAIALCQYLKVPVFMKQLGSAVAFRNSRWELPGQPWREDSGKRKPWDDPTEWPVDLRVQEWPA